MRKVGKNERKKNNITIRRTMEGIRWSSVVKELA